MQLICVILRAVFVVAASPTFLQMPLQVVAGPPASKPSPSDNHSTTFVRRANEYLHGIRQLHLGAASPCMTIDRSAFLRLSARGNVNKAAYWVVVVLKHL